MFRKGKIAKSLQLLQKDTVALKKKVCVICMRFESQVMVSRITAKIVDMPDCKVISLTGRLVNKNCYEIVV